MGKAFSPLDRRLGLLAGQYTPQVHEWLVQLSAWMPFAVAVKLLASMVGVKVSKASALRSTEAAGAAYVTLQEEEVAALERKAPPAPRCRERMVISADGAMVPLLHGEWGEVRTLAIGVVTGVLCRGTAAPPAARQTNGPHSAGAGSADPPPKRRQPPGQTAAPGGKTAAPAPATAPTELHTQQITYFSRLANAEAFTRAALVETHRRGLENAKEIAAVNDGADWLQTFTDHHCPQAIRILDFAHAAQRIGETAQALWGQGTDAATQWTQSWTHRLKHEGPQPLIAELRQLQHQHPDNEPLRINLAYLEKRQPQLQYPAFSQADWPIGSGMVESANKLVVEARLKGAGMHWQREHVNPMLALRNLVCSDRWPQVWPQIQARLVAQTDQKRSAPHRQRLAAAQANAQAAALAAQRAQYAALHPEWLTDAPTEPPPPRTAKPTPDHPWKRSPIGRARFTNSHNPKT